MILASRRFDLVERFRARRVFSEEIRTAPGRFAMMFRATMAAGLTGADLGRGCLIYSLWPGYLDRDRVDLRAWASAAGLDFEVVHSSGHAGWADLQRMTRAVNPRVLVPIHTEHPEAFTQLFPRVCSLPNGAWLDVSEEPSQGHS
jgi:ribonuclease J